MNLGGNLLEAKLKAEKETLTFADNLGFIHRKIL